MDIDVKLLSQILQSAPEYIFWKDEHLVYRGCNENFAKLAGFDSPSQVVGKRDTDMPWGDYTGHIYMEEDEHILKTGGHISHKEVPIKLEGWEQEKYLSISKVPLYNDEKRIIGVMGIFIDVTKQKEITESLKEAKQKAESTSQAKTDFIANMSHDLRTPITGMTGMVEDLKNTADDIEAQLDNNPPATQAEWMGLVRGLTQHIKEDGVIVTGAIDQLLQLCNEILEVTRLEKGILKEAATSFDLHGVIKRNIDMLQPMAKHRRLGLSAEIDPAIPQYCNGLRNYLDRSLLNIISNALKFTDAGSVKVRVELENSNTKSHQKGDAINLKISIEDTGIGIPEDKFESIFEHFSRLTPSFEGVYKGFGLGLYTVKRYVEAMQGEISVHSKLGQGSCFVLRLPLTVCDKDDRPQQSLYAMPASLSVPLPLNLPTSTTDTETPSSRILIVEDSTLAAFALKVSLKPFHCAIDLAETGPQGLALAEQNDYDLIFMDVGLPGLSGVEVTEAIRALADPQKAQVPIVAITGHADNLEMRQACLDAGMQDVFAKPMPKSALTTVLQRYVFGGALAAEASSEIQKEVAAELSLIDWEACLQMYAGDVEIARDVISNAPEELERALAEFEKFYPARDIVALRLELHKVIGGLAYLCLPRVEQSIRAFQVAVRTAPSDFDAWERTYQSLKETFAAFHAEWQKGGPWS